MTRFLVAIVVIACMALGHADARSLRDRVVVERIILVMRHGVRPPTKDPAMAAGVAAEPWPAWDVKPGYLTGRGAVAVKLLGRFDRAVIAAPLLAAGSCPAPHAVSVYSDSDERTIATGDAWIAGFAPGCGIANRHRAQDDNDPLFSGRPSDPARADAIARAQLGAGGVAALEAAHRDALARLDRIYCGPSPSVPCGVSRIPTRLAPARPGKKPSFEGALDLGSTAGQILLLEYADGRPMPEVGWGRATSADIAVVSELHALEYSVLARPHTIAAGTIAPVLERMLAALADRSPGAARIALFIGHDTQVAALGGLFDLHWQAPGIARDDPPPGGALGFELVRDARGRQYVRGLFRAQSLEQMRTLAQLSAAEPATVTILPIAGCAGSTPAGCPLASFLDLAKRRLAER